MLVSQFIEKPLMEEIRDMTMGKDGNATHPYLGFVLTASSIEFLGACLDTYEWSDVGLSEKRFRLAIKELFPVEYGEYNKKGCKFDLYSNLRCSMVHSSRPGNNIGVSEKRHGLSNALEIHGDKLIICFEYFFQDFVGACEILLQKIKNKEINCEKVYKHILKVPQE